MYNDFVSRECTYTTYTTQLLYAHGGVYIYILKIIPLALIAFIIAMWYLNCMLFITHLCHIISLHTTDHLDRYTYYTHLPSSDLPTYSTYTYN